MAENDNKKMYNICNLKMLQFFCERCLVEIVCHYIDRLHETPLKFFCYVMQEFVGLFGIFLCMQTNLF